MINDNTLTKLYTKMNLNSNRNPKLMTTTAAHIPTMVILTLYSMSFHTMACRISGLGFDFSFKFIWARCECIQISLLSRHNIIKIFLLKIGPNTFQVWNLTLTSWGSKCQRYCDKKEGKNLSDAIHNGVKVFMNSLIKFPILIF